MTQIQQIIASKTCSAQSICLELFTSLALTNRSLVTHWYFKFSWLQDTPLHCAIQYNHVNTARFLIECGAEVNAHNANRVTEIYLRYNYNRAKKINEIIFEDLCQAHCL